MGSHGSLGGTYRGELLVARIGDVPACECYRVLVDRLWPRGIRKETAPWEEWLPAVAPSAALRRWYGHDSTRYPEFRVRYELELAAEPGASALQRLVGLVQSRPVALVTATRDVAHSQVPILADFLARATGLAWAFAEPAATRPRDPPGPRRKGRGASGS
jgi:uncharacterized protein YeaO (DUF488 family)